MKKICTLARSARGPSGIAIFCLIAAGAAAQGWQHIGDVQKVSKLVDGMELSAGGAKVRVTSVSDGVVRVARRAKWQFSKRFFLGGELPRRSRGNQQLRRNGKASTNGPRKHCGFPSIKSPLLIRFL